MPDSIGAEEDLRLLKAWAEGAHAPSLEALLGRHEALMRRAAGVALGRAGRMDPGLVDEAVQEARLRLMTALASFRGEAAPATFLAAVARRAALDELRKEGRHRGRMLRAFALGPREEGGAGDPALGLEARAGAEAARAALEDLGEPERSLVYLRDAEGLEVQELAQVFGLAEGTVKSKLFRARRRLRTRLEREGWMP
jgi:RNA polymerase sigma-70 factor (ECF subfamily)